MCREEILRTIKVTLREDTAAMLSADAANHSARLLDALRAIPEDDALPAHSLKGVAESYVLPPSDVHRD